MTETMDLVHSIDAKLVRNIGEQSVSSNIQAIIELIKNSYDADALNCKVHFYADGQIGDHIKMNKVVIEDNGFGMTVEDFQNKWMRVATTSKNEVEGGNISPILQRVVSGEKGMGRFSAQRLGNIIKVISNPEDYTGRTKTEYGHNTLELIINWNQYLPGKDFGKIANKLKLLDTKADTPGIKIEITDLKDSWSLNDIDAIVTNAGSLVSPKIIKESNKKSFNVEIVPHGFIPHKTDVESIVEKYAPWQIKAQLFGSKLNFQIFHKNKEEVERRPVVDLSKRIKGRGEIPVGSNTLGNMKIELLFFNENAGTWAPKSVQKFSKLTDNLNMNSGIKIFNDGIRIMPYGNKDNDWVGLDDRYVKRRGGRHRNRNVIGYVFLTRTNNPEIKETTTREGLVQNEEFKFLQKRIMIDIVKEFEQYKIEWKNIEDKDKPIIYPTAKAESYITQLTDFVESLDIKKAEKIEIGKLAKQARKNVLLLEDEKKENVERAVSNLELYRNLASLGISALAFHHEIRPEIGNISQRLNTIFEKWETMDDIKKQDYISKATRSCVTVIDLNQYIISFARLFSGASGSRTPITEINFKASFDDFKDRFSNVLEDAAIDVEIITGPGHLKNLYMNSASWQSIMMNLLGNSIKALGNVQRKKKFIKILLEKTATNLRLTIEDNGSGILESNFERIFDPLMTTAKGITDTGTGMGMTVIREIVEDDYEGRVMVKSSKYEKEFPGKGRTAIQIEIPLDNLKANKQ